MAAPKLEQVAGAKQTEAELVEQLKKQHGIGKIFMFAAETGETVYCRAPAVGVWRRFRSQMQNPAKRDEAGEVLVRSCVLFPEKGIVDAWLEERPALVETFADELAQIAGLSKDVEKKVL